jgi:DNA-binding CsgD family transcriptional regulator
VKFHVASLLGKLRVRTRTEAVTAGIRLGLISL